MRSCGYCGGSMEGKRPHAIYCSRTCKTKASDERRLMDGRAKRRDRARYAREAKQRRAYARSQYADHREAYLRRSRAWRKSNPVGRKLQHQRRRARQLGRDCREITERDWRRLIALCDGRCYYCRGAAQLVVDHVIPLARGGRHAIGNVVPACEGCNASKGAALLVEWRARGRGVIHPHPT